LPGQPALFLPSISAIDFFFLNGPPCSRANRRKLLHGKSCSFPLTHSLKYRFELNLKDLNFVVESLLSGLKDSLFEELNVELLTTQLKRKEGSLIVERQGEQANALLEESKKQKRELWNTLKIKSFTRTIVSVYLINMVAILTCVQLSILGKYMYLDSVVSLGKKDPAEEAQETEKIVSEETERNYLTMSWFLLNVGWKNCMHRVQNSVETIVGGYFNVAYLDYL
jgi:peroxin-3